MTHHDPFRGMADGSSGELPDIEPAQAEAPVTEASHDLEPAQAEAAQAEAPVTEGSPGQESDEEDSAEQVPPLEASSIESANSPASAEQVPPLEASSIESANSPALALLLPYAATQLLPARLLSHAAAELFPMATEEELEGLTRDIKAHGLREPIVLYQGRILDGRNRYEACLRAGVEPRFVEWDGSGGSPVSYVLSRNLHRRQIDKGQRAMIGLNALPLEEEYARERSREAQREAARQTNEKRRRSSLDLGSTDGLDATGDEVQPANEGAEIDGAANEGTSNEASANDDEVAAPEAADTSTPVDEAPAPVTRKPLKAAAVVAKGLGICAATLQKAKKLQKEEPELAEAVRQGKANGGLTLEAAVKESKRRQHQQSRAALEEGACTVADLLGLVDEIRSGRRAPFGCIYVDPPYRYKNKAARGNAESHYPTMSWEEILALPVSDLAAPASHLHLWAPVPFHRVVYEVLDAWGFEWCGEFVWVKNQLGLGNRWRTSHEVMVLGVRKKLPFYDKSLKSWIQADRGAHSAKPEEVRGLIERASPGPYLELFGRQPVEGWTVWGNEIPQSAFAPSAQDPTEDDETIEEPVTDPTEDDETIEESVTEVSPAQNASALPDAEPAADAIEISTSSTEAAATTELTLEEVLDNDKGDTAA